MEPTLDIANAPLAEVRANLRARRDQGLPLPEAAATEINNAADTSDDDVVESRGGAEQPQRTAQRVEDDETENAATKQETTPDVTSELARERERFQTLSANNKRMSDELKELREWRTQQEQAQRDAEVKRKQDAFRQAEEYIKRNVPAADQERVFQEYKNRILAGELSQYDTSLTEREQNLAGREQEIELRRVRSELPKHIDSINEFIAQEAQADPEFLREVAKQAPFVELLERYEHPRDLAIIGEVLHAVMLAEKGRGRAVRQQNREEASASGAAINVSNVGGAAGGPTMQERISAIPKKDWNKFREELKRNGGNFRKAASSVGVAA